MNDKDHTKCNYRWEQVSEQASKWWEEKEGFAEQNKYEEKSFKITFQLIEVWLVDYIGNYLKNIGKLN